MARPTKHGLDYFPVDVQFDDKIELLIAECGPCTVSVLITIWQLIYQNEGYFIPNSPDLLLLLKRRILIEPEDSSKIINAAISRNIFSQGMAERHNILTSKAIQSRYFIAAKRKKVVYVYKNYIMDGVFVCENVAYKALLPDKVNINATNVEVEVEVKEKEKVKVKEDEERDKQKSTKVLGKPKPSPSRFVDSDFLDMLKQNKAYQDLDLDAELGKCQAWCLANTKSDQPTRKRFVNWINRAYGGRADKPAYQSKSDITKNSVKTVLAELEKQERSYHAPTIINPMPR